MVVWLFFSVISKLWSLDRRGSHLRRSGGLGVPILESNLSRDKVPRFQFAAALLQPSASRSLTISKAGVSPRHRPVAGPRDFRRPCALNRNRTGAVRQLQDAVGAMLEPVARLLFRQARLGFLPNSLAIFQGQLGEGEPEFLGGKNEVGQRLSIESLRRPSNSSHRARERAY